MSNWYYRDGTFVPENELYHYGVKGMRWGHRKAVPITVGQGVRRANAARAEAWRKSTQAQGGRLVGKSKSFAVYPSVGAKLKARNATRVATNQAGIKSVQESKAENQRSREQKKAERNTPEAKAARKKAMIKAGVAIAGTALAAYGTYKVAKYMQDKRNQAAMSKAQDYVKNNFMERVGVSEFKDGSVQMTFKNPKYGGVSKFTGTNRKEAGQAVGKHNAKVIATAKQMYKDSTNTKLDRGLSKVVNTGDRVGNAAKAAANKAKSAATNAANKVKDYVSDYEMPSIRSNKVPPHLRNTTLDPRGNYWKKRRR